MAFSSRIVKGIETLRNHKKKAIFFTICFGFGGRWIQKRQKDINILSKYCEKARIYGETPTTSMERPRRIAVLINSYAKDGKAKVAFEKNVLPLFHLAGLEVSILAPSDVSQLEAMAGALDTQEADAIYVVGGDGTLSRVIHGIITANEQRKATSTKVSKKKHEDLLPIGIFPGGHKNYSLRRLWTQQMTVDEENLNNLRIQWFPQNDVQWYCESAMALIKDAKQNLRFFDVTIGEERTFAVSQIHTGPFQFLDDKKLKYWYWGGWKGKFAFLWKSIRGPPKPFESALEYVPVCSGCSKCYAEKKAARAEKIKAENSGWSLMGLLFGRSIRVGNQSDEEMLEDCSNVENELCGVVNVEPTRKTVEILAENTNPIKGKLTDIFLRFGPETMSRSEFIREGWKRVKEKNGLGSGNRGTEEFHAESVVIQSENSESDARLKTEIGQPEEPDDGFSLEFLQNYTNFREDVPLVPYVQASTRQIAVDGELFDAERVGVEIRIYPRKVPIFVPESVIPMVSI